jgi:hypothetical protein
MTTAVAPRRTATWTTRAGGLLSVVLVPWLVARVIVLGALALAHLVVSHDHPDPAAVARVHQGLLGWDAGWYEAIAKVGYAPLSGQPIRFFPLVPLVTRGLALAPGVSDGVALVVLANLSALAATALLVVLVRRETGDADLARRSAWLLSLVPPAFVLVMGYAEGTLLLLSVGTFVAVRRGSGASAADGVAPSWCWAAVLGFAAALTRPLGVLLVLPVAWEAYRWWSRGRGGARVASVVAAAAPLAGLLVFLSWSRAAGYGFLGPVRAQTQAGHHGGLSDPFTTLAHDATGVLHHHVGTALHVPWVLGCLVLVVLCWRRWPAAYGLFATAVVVVALSGTNLDSFERYALSAFPLVLTGATLTASPRVERVVLTLAAAGLAGYALLAFLNLSVP